MASNGLRIMLQTAVQTVNWTYSLFWQPCPQRGILVWGDGYYNGAIKTRKTMQPMEVSTEEASLERSQQLRELYDNLTNHPTRPPSAALLSPEDLTETEWYYLMCVSFSFPPGVGLPGKAYAKRQHIWLTGANEIDSKVFTRAILAKSARVQTVVCIPLLDGVVEFGTTERVREDPGFLEQVKKLLAGHNHQSQPQPPKQALSEHSSSSQNPLLPNSPQMDEDEDEEEEEEEGEAESDSAAETDCDSQPSHTVCVAKTTGEPSELIQDDMSEDIRVGSPDDYSNNLDVDFHLLAVTQQRGGSFRDESTSCWQANHDPLTTNIHPPVSESIKDYSHYSETISSILDQRSNRWFKVSSTDNATYSAFTTWTTTNSNQVPPTSPTSQWLLKYIIFTVPFLHTNSCDIRFTPQDDLAANHVIAERRRREKLNERFITLRSLVPFVTKMDKASILGDTIEYVKQLRKKIEDLETTNQMGKRKVRIVEDNITDRTKALPLESPPHLETQVEVSIIESDALVELQCPYREGLLLDVMQKLRDLHLEISTVQSSLNNGFFVTEMRATVKKKVTIMEAKRAIRQIILVD